MKLPAIACVPVQSLRGLGLAALLILPFPVFAQDDPDLAGLLFEVAGAPIAGSSDPQDSAELPSPSPDAPPTPATAPESGSSEIGSDTAEAESDTEETTAALTRSRISEYERAVAELEQNDGPFASGLTERLQVLGALHEQAGDHESAIATYEKAVHILRVNDGLFTLAQLPLVERIIHNYQAMDNYREAGNRQEYVYYVKQKNYDEDHPEMIQAMFDWADWNVQAYYRELEENANSRFTITQSAGPLTGDLVPVVGPNNTVYYVPRNQGFGSGYGLNNSLFNTGGMSVQYMLDPRLRTARDLYEKISERADGGGSAAALLPRTERKLANISYIVKQEMDYLESTLRRSNFFAGRGFRPEQNPEVSRGYVRGRDSLEKVVDTLRADEGAEPEEIARAIIDLGDWQLTYERPQAAYESYREAYAVLSGAGVTEAGIDAIFAPVPAVEIPTYATHRHSRATLGIPADAAVPYRGYIDVRLNIDRYGNVRGPRVEGMSPDTDNDVRNALLDHLRMAKLRPRLVAGEAVEQEDMVLRYYYSY